MHLVKIQRMMEKCLTETDFFQKDTVDELENLVKLTTNNPKSATKRVSQSPALRFSSGKVVTLEGKVGHS